MAQKLRNIAEVPPAQAHQVFYSARLVNFFLARYDILSNDDRSEHDGQGVHWKRMDGYFAAWHPTRIMNKLQSIVWMDFFEPLWQNRNDLFHQQNNNYERAEDDTLTEQLEWYQSNRHTLLAHHDHFLLHNTNTPMLHTMPSRQKREWIRHLTAAKLANTQELTLMKTNHHSLF